MVLCLHTDWPCSHPVRLPITVTCGHIAHTSREEAGLSLQGLHSFPSFQRQDLRDG